MIGNRDEIKEKLREKTSPHIGMGGRFFFCVFSAQKPNFIDPKSRY